MPLAIGVSQTYSLQEAIKIALENKEALKASAMDLESSRQEVKGSYSKILPSVQISGNWNETRFPSRTGGYNQETGELTLDKINSQTSASTGLYVSQNIYDGGVWWNTINQSKNNYKISAQYDRQVKIKIIQNVHETYFNYLKAQQLMDVARSNLMSAQQQLALAEQKFELKSVKKTDLLKAEVGFGRARIAVVNNDANLQYAYRNLKNAMGLVGQEADFSITATDATVEMVPEFETGFEILQKKNPSVLAKQFQIVGARIGEKLAKGATLPNLSANISYSGSASDFSTLSDSWSERWSNRIGLSLSLPIFTGRSLKTRIEQAIINIRVQESEYLTQLQDLSVQLQGILDQLNNYQEIIPINETVLVSAEEDLKLARLRYTQGSTTILEVLDAQASVASARSSLISSNYDALIEQARLKAMLGTLDSELQ